MLPEGSQAKVPAAHELHTAAPIDEYDPGGHTTQAEDADEPDADNARPAEHCTQLAAPTCAWKLPAEQLAQSMDAEAPAKVPAPQLEHLLAPATE